MQEISCNSCEIFLGMKSSVYGRNKSGTKKIGSTFFDYRGFLLGRHGAVIFSLP